MCVIFYLRTFARCKGIRFKSMRILLVSRYKPQFANHILPFVVEQGAALRQLGNQVDCFLVQGKGLLSYFRQVGPLKEKIREFRPDVVHGHYGLSGITTVLACKELPKTIRPKCVVTFHNGETLGWKQNLLSSSFSLLADYVIYVAQHIRELSYFKAKRYAIMPCGVNLEELPIIPYEEARQQLAFAHQTKYILFGGTFDNKRKNVQLLFDALNLMSDKPCFTAEHPSGVIKNGVSVEVLEMRGLSREECTLRMCACDLFALPTHSEGSPQALKEAMACNCPIVATDVADIKELLGDIAGHYLLRNPRHTKKYWDADESSIAEMAELLAQALSTSARTKGRERIVAYNLTNNQIAQQLLDIYHHC